MLIDFFEFSLKY